ncbi:hydroxymethylglutaryl-CoA synthase: cytoplasmic-like isoform X2, partial [Dinothrombium tinctorium]
KTTNAMPSNSSLANAQQTNGTNGCHQWPADIGILAVEMYFPSTFVDQSELEQFDGVSSGKYTIGLGQTRMGFCSDREDINSLCLTVTKALLEKSAVSPKDIGFLMVGTETVVDKSKSVKSVLMQLFVESGNSDILGLDTTNACYGGTAALFHAVDWIESSNWDGRYAIVVAGDIAIYSEGNARPTGGAGAVAMLVGPNAPLVLERGMRATHMAHVYDFYKPILDSEYPVVDGKLSVVCYTECVDKCYQVFRNKYEKVINKTLSLNDFDGILLHSPYCKLVQKSIARLLFNEFLREPKPDFQGFYSGLESMKTLKLEDTYFDKGVESTFVKLSTNLFNEKTKPSLFLSTEVGNMYTASLYSCLVSYLLSKPLNKLEGKRALLFSYGSGMAASMYTIKITNDSSPGSPLDRLYQGIKDVHTHISQRVKVPPKEFVDILKLREGSLHAAPYTPKGTVDNMFPGTYYLTSVDKMYRREYERVPKKVAN